MNLVASGVSRITSHQREPSPREIRADSRPLPRGSRSQCAVNEPSRLPSFPGASRMATRCGRGPAAFQFMPVRRGSFPLAGLEMDNGRARTPIRFAGEGEGSDGRMPTQNGVNRLAQLSDPLAVDHADFKNAFLTTGGEVFSHDLLHILWAEGVQIEHAIDRQ